MRLFWGLIGLTSAALAFQGPAAIQEFSHPSQVMGGARTYRVFFPASYERSQKRYPVVYWFHGFENSAQVEAYSREISAYLAAHDVLVVDSGPVETTGEFPQYLPELIEQIDRTLRTIPDRDHRAVTGFSAGGFMAFFFAAKYPDLVSSASSLMGPTEYAVGPKGFDVEFRADDFYADLAGVRTRLVTGSRDFIQFYHRRLNAEWLYAKGNHETEDFDSDHAPAGVSKTLDFHMHAFNNALPKPAVFNHADPYPNFSVWGWEVTSDRRQPGYTVLENVSPAGFRSAVREWIPSGATIASVKLSVASPPVYIPGSAHAATVLRLRDGKFERRTIKADPRGRLNFDLDGDSYEVSIGAEGQIAVTGYEIADGAWVTAGQPARLRVKFSNKGAARLPTLPVRWECSDPALKVDAPGNRLFGLGPGESGSMPLTIEAPLPAHPIARIFAVIGGSRLRLDVPVFPPAEPARDFQIADGRKVNAWRHGADRADLEFGEGNGDGHAAPGETFAILLPDGDALRAAELFSSDSCLDLSVRASDSWSDYDHTGASAKYTLATIRKDCQPGRIVHLLAHITMPNAPNHSDRYAAIEFPIWYRLEQ